MLLLSRKKGEKIRIGENVTLTVVAVQGNRVKIGFEAPREISIARTELTESSPKLPSLDFGILDTHLSPLSDDDNRSLPAQSEKTVVCNLD